MDASAASPAPEVDPLVGTSVGNFKILRRIGRGGMGTVYLGEHASIASKVAIKFLHPALATEPSLVERFFAEARAANLVGHENIVKVFDLGQIPPGRYYLIMEYLEGEPLSQRIGTPWQTAAAVDVLCQVCEALQAAHARGIVHRDLKPENIFLVRPSGPGSVKLLDFGIAKLGEGKGPKTQAGAVVGTPEYMAPEQWRADSVDGRADLYALGVIGYALLTGGLPFVEASPLGVYLAHAERIPEPPSRYNAAIPPALEQAILRSLAKSRDDRFQTGHEFRDALLAALDPNARVVAPAAAPRAPAPKPAAPPPAAPAAAPIRVRLVVSGAEPRLLDARDVTRGGLFLCSDAPPPIMSRVALELPQASGWLRCEADVVSHVTAEQARSWGMAPGFAVQFARPDAALRAAVDLLRSGVVPSPQPAPAAAEPDASALAEIELALDKYARKPANDPYALLGAPLDAECSELRAKVRQALAQLEPMQARAVGAEQRGRVQATLARIKHAQEIFATPQTRAAFDASRENFRGIARCLSAGLPVGELEALRKAYLAEHPKNLSASILQLATAKALAAQGQHAQAAQALEKALKLDPLNLEVHQRYWALKRQAR